MQLKDNNRIIKDIRRFKRKIIIQSDREIITSEVAGVIEEHNAEIMTFEFPSEICGISTENMTKWLIFDIDGLDPQEIKNNKYTIPSIITEKEYVKYQIMLKYDEEILYKSMIKTLYFDDTLKVEKIQINLDDLSVINRLKKEHEEVIEKGTKIIEEVDDINNRLTQRIIDLDFKVNTETGRLEVNLLDE